MGPFIRENASWLSAGALLTFGSSFGQTYFISLFAGEIKNSFGLTDGAWGGIYTIGTTLSAVTMIWAGVLTDRFRARVLACLVMPGLALTCLAMGANRSTVGLLLVVFFLADILFMRPLGLWTALVVLGSEFLRSRSFMLRDMPFLYEWFLVSGVVVAVFLGNTLMLAIFAVDQPSLGLTLIGLVATILAYPLVVILGGRGVGVKKIVPGEVDRLGHKQ